MLSSTYTARAASIAASDVVAVGDRLEVVERRVGRLLREHARLLGERRVAEREPRREAVELRLGERIRAFVLDRVLRRDDEERQLERVRDSPSIVTWLSCIASRSADCVFGDARLISSTSRTFVNTGPGRNSNSFVFWLNTFTPVTSVGQQVRRELEAREGQVERAGERLREHRLPHAREVLDDQVALGEQAEDAELERVARRAHGELEVRDDALDDACGVRGRRRLRGAGSESLMRSRVAARPRPEPPPRSRASAPSATRPLARLREDDDLVLGGVEADVRAAHVVEDDEIGVLG